ncbi:hypothetical protein [Thalassoglobus sp.]|uniref:hypothetical protein n=1 Tax=Thalassoglobus sp. TaxID=2795869 RepID=UPI003AA8F84A
MKSPLMPAAVCILWVVLSPRISEAQVEFTLETLRVNQWPEVKTAREDVAHQEVFWDFVDSVGPSPIGFSDSDQPIGSLLDEPFPRSANLGNYGGLIVRGQSPSSGGGAGANAGQQAQNPIASLVSLPYQSNWAFGNGPEERTQYFGLLQPVLPLSISEEFTLITRPIIPFVNSPVGATENENGLGDIQWENILVPKPPEGSPWMWGAGVDITAPTASDPALGRGLWAVGPAFVLVYSQSPVVGGFLVTQSFSEGGVYKPFFFQPFFNYNFTEGILKEWFINVSGEFQADWEAPSDSRWNNVLGVGPGKNMKIFGQPTQLRTRFGRYLDSPTDADWQFQFQINFLFPK